MQIQAEWKLPGNLQELRRSMTNREFLMRVQYLREKAYEERTGKPYPKRRIGDANVRADVSRSVWQSAFNAADKKT